MRDGLEVEFGAADGLAVKIVALDAVIERYRERRVATDVHRRLGPDAAPGGSRPADPGAMTFGDLD